jgi:hypothetical protein
MFFFSTFQPVTLESPHGSPVNILAASASSLSCHLKPGYGDLCKLAAVWPRVSSTVANIHIRHESGNLINPHVIIKPVGVCNI